jgi:hypothetical protein
MILDTLKSSSCGGRELDYAIGRALDQPSFEHARDDFPVPFVPGSKADREVPEWSTSVDQVLALVSRKLPGWSVQMSLNRDNIGNHARIGGDHLIGEPVGFYHGNKPLPITILIALFTDLEAQTDA